MARVLLVRALLFALPFAAWFAWREVARRTGRPMGSTPWAWLVAIGAILAAASLMATAVVPRGADTGRYVPAEVGADGRVTPGHFVPRPPARDTGVSP
ncbi:MAG: hypothetical protein ABI376_08430 [Caulobacteraceae bacterium]